MSIKTPEDEINIKDLVLDEPSSTKNPYFVTEREIPEGDWQEMLKTLDDYRKRDVWTKFSILATGMSLLYPSRASELGLTNRDKQALSIMSFGQSSTIDPFDQLLALKVLFDQDISKTEFAAPFWEGAEKFIDSNLLRRDWWHYVSQIFKIGLVLPAKMQEVDLSEESYQGISHYLNLISGNHPEIYAQTALRLKMLYPGKPNSNVAKLDWDFILKGLRDKRELVTDNKLGWDLVASYASEIKLLAAAEIINTPTSLEAIMSKPDLDQPPPLPEPRTF